MTGDDQPGSRMALAARTLSELDARIVTPVYDRATLGRGIVHIGVGGFHRAHQAVYLDVLCAEGVTDWSITGAGVLPGDAAMEAALKSQDYLYTLITRDEHAVDVRIIGSITEYVLAHEGIDALVSRLADPSTRIVSLTVTEGGYPVDESTGAFVPPPTDSLPPAFEAIARALRLRRAAGQSGFTVLSCDNIMGNGATARTATLGVAGMVETGLDDWVALNTTFPNGMVDRITPATTDADRRFLADRYGLIDRWPVVAEPFIQWVVEDDFPFGRPPWQDAGVLFTSDVRPYETLKLRILNAGHSTLAYLAALVGHTYVHEMVTDAPFQRFLRHILDDEVTPSLPAVPGIDVNEYKAVVVKRFANPEVRDQVSRLCLDGSSKFPKFLLPTVIAQLDQGGDVRLSALALAGWCQYLLGKDERGRDIEPAGDPALPSAQKYAAASMADPRAFLGFRAVFGERLPSDPVFAAAFIAALTSIRESGVYATLERWLPDD